MALLVGNGFARSESRSVGQFHVCCGDGDSLRVNHGAREAGGVVGREESEAASKNATNGK